MKKSFIAFIFCLISTLTQAQMAVFDASSFGQLVEQVNELEKSYTELRTQGRDISRALDSLTTLGDAANYQWSSDEILSLMNQMNTVMERNQAISYTASNLDSQFMAHFPGYAGNSSGQNYQTQYQTNVHDTLSTINNSLSSIGMNTSDFATESSRLNAIHSHVQGAVGQTQALQALSEVNEELVTQTQSLRQIVSAQANSESTYYAQQIQQKATSQANLDTVVNAGSTEDVVYGSNPDDILHSPY